MAYGLRIRIEYKDINDLLTQINIYQDEYAGVADVRYANAGCRVQWGDESNPDPLVYGASCTLFFDSEFEAEFMYLFTSDAKKHLVEVLKGGNVLIKAFIEPDSWGEPLRAAPYPVQATGYDGLGFLRDVKYTTHPGVRTSLLDILIQILAETGLDLIINYSVNYQEQAENDYLDHTINDTVYAEKSCYEVLEQLFQGCIIYQRAGQWHITDYATLKESGATVSDFWPEGTPQKKMYPALRKRTVIQELGYNKNLVQNGSFEYFNQQLAKFDEWDNVNVSPVQGILNDDGDKYVLVPGSQITDYLTSYIKKSLPVVQTTSILNIAMKYALMGAKNSGYVLFTVILQTDTARYELSRKQRTSKSEEWEWVARTGTIECFATSNRMVKTDETIVEDGEIVPAYRPDANLIAAWPKHKVTDHFEEFRASVAGIPADGVLEIYLSVPMTSVYDANIQGACFTGVSFELLDEDNQQYPTELKFDLVNSLKNNLVPADLKLVNGDYPDNIPNVKIIYSGGFQRPNGTATTGWRGYGTAYYSYADFIGRMLASKQVAPRDAMSARLADVVPLSLIVFIDAENTGKLMIEAGITYDDRYQAIEGTFIELAAIDVETFGVNSDTAYTVPVKFPGIRIPDPINIEHRVTIMDRIGAVTTGPAYLYENDFELREAIESEPNDGFSRLQIKEMGVTPYNLSRDAGTLQFSLTSILEANVDGNENKIRFNAGEIISHNFFALDKDHREEAENAL